MGGGEVWDSTSLRRQFRHKHLPTIADRPLSYIRTLVTVFNDGDSRTGLKERQQVCRPVPRVAGLFFFSIGGGEASLN